MVGRADAIAAARAHPLARAVRIDKLSLAALEATLRLYRDPERARREVPVLAMLDVDAAVLRARAERLAAGIGDLSGANEGVSVVDATAKVGGGALPLLELDGPVVRIDGGSPDRLAARLRAAEPPVVGRIADGAAVARPADAGRGRGRPRRGRRPRRIARVSGDLPLTLGTAGHIDHGKTALVGALTGRDTDRLPEEKERGISIALGYAPMTLPSGRRLSVVDVPGHERFVRTMVAGATGIDLFLMTIAADDGVMPQTREHAAVLAGLGVTAGVVAITKSDLADPEAAAAQAAELFGAGVEIVAVSSRTGAGLDELRAGLDRVAAGLASRAAGDGPARLHVDRVFTVKGAGTVVTGTLWSGTVGRGDEIVILPPGRRARVRGVQVHDEPAERAPAGQRVAVNLVGVDRDEVERGDVLAAPGAALEPSFRIDAEVTFDDDRRPEHGDRIQVHHGTRETAARVAELGGRFFQLRLEQPLVPAAGDRLVLRAIAPPDTLGGGVVLDPAPRRHGPSRDLLARLERLSRGEPVEPAPPEPSAPPEPEPVEPLSPGALALEQRLLEAGFEPPIESALGDEAAELPALRSAGRAVRVGRALHYHPEPLAEIRERVRAHIEREGSITLAELRDELGTSRKFAQALLEHLDATHVTLRRPDDSRVLRRS